MSKKKGVLANTVQLYAPAIGIDGPFQGPFGGMPATEGYAHYVRSTPGYQYIAPCGGTSGNAVPMPQLLLLKITIFVLIALNYRGGVRISTYLRPRYELSAQTHYQY